MNFVKLLMFSAVAMIIMQNCHAMISEKKRIDLHIVNYASEPLLITFVDPERVLEYHTSKYVQDLTIGESKAYEFLNARSPISRYMRELRPNGILDIKDFMEDQKISASLKANPKIEVIISDHLKKEFDKPGTAIVNVKIKEMPGSIWTKFESQKTLYFDLGRPKKTLEELKALETEPAVKKEKEFEKGTAKGLEEIKTEEQALSWYDLLKKNKQEEAKTLGKWGKVMLAIFDDEIAQLTKVDVYKILELPEIATAEQLFKWTLVGENPMLPKIVYRKVLSPAFHNIYVPDLLKEFGFAKRTQEKATFVDRLILEQYGKLR